MRSLFVTLFSLLIACSAFAEYTDQQGVYAILAESRMDGYKGMYATACAIRNRGDLRGVYGLNADMEPIDAKVSDMAVKAWYLSQSGNDVTHGATHWLSDYDIKYCRPARTAFRFKMQETLYQGHTHYYKRR